MMHRADKKMLAFLAWLVVATVAAVGAGFWVVADQAHAATNCGVVAHRFGSTATIDDNTLEGLARTTAMNARGEGDLLPTTDGLVLFHQKRWEQGTTGEGVPWETTTAYADSLTTTRNHQQIPLFGQVLDYGQAHPSRFLFEAHYWQEAWTKSLLADAVAQVQNRGLAGQVQWTGTNAMMMALADISPAAVTVWRVDPDQTPTRAYVKSRSIEILQITSGRTRADIRMWRSWGLKVTGRNTRQGQYQEAYNHGLRVIQVLSGNIQPWLNYCRGGGQ